MKINFGCGRRVLREYFNVDAVHNSKAPYAPELLHAIEFDQDGSVRNPLPLPSGCADELFSAHVVEHVHDWQAPHLLAEWKRLIRPGGALVLELPNIEAAARHLLEGKSDQWCMWPLYGDGSHRDPWMCHKYGYTPKTIRRLVEEAGFVDVRLLPPQTHGPRPDRDMRVEARKP